MAASSSRIPVSEKKSLDLTQYNLFGKQFIAFFKQQKRDPALILKIEKAGGFCEGLSILVGYALWLQQQPKSMSESVSQRDDWDWLYGAFTLLASWDGIKPFTETEIRDIDRLFFLVSYFHVNFSGPSILTGSKAEELSFERAKDTKGRELKNEYVLPTVMSADHLLTPITVNSIDKKTEESTTILNLLVKKNKIIIVNLARHAMTLFQSDTHYYLYDSNLHDLKKTTEFKEFQSDVIERINFYYKDKMGVLSFRVLNVVPESKEEKQSTVYPSSAEIIKQLPLFKDDSVNLSRVDSSNPNSTMDTYSPLIAALYEAARTSCPSAIEYYLSKGASINTREGPRGELIMLTKTLRLTEITNFLEEQGWLDTQGRTGLHIAAEKNDAKRIEYLIENKCIPIDQEVVTTPDLYVAPVIRPIETKTSGLPHESELMRGRMAEVTPLFLAVVRGHVEATTLLLEKKANLFNVNIDISPFHQVILDKDIELVNLFFNQVHLRGSIAQYNEEQLLFMLLNAIKYKHPVSIELFKTLLDLPHQAITIKNFIKNLKTDDQFSSVFELSDASSHASIFEIILEKKPNLILEILRRIQLDKRIKRGFEEYMTVRLFKDNQITLDQLSALTEDGLYLLCDLSYAEHLFKNRQLTIEQLNAIGESLAIEQITPPDKQEKVRNNLREYPFLQCLLVHGYLRKHHFDNVPFIEALIEKHSNKDRHSSRKRRFFGCCSKKPTKQEKEIDHLLDVATIIFARSNQSVLDGEKDEKEEKEEIRRRQPATRGK
jgi:ankyrin repeat protein